MKKNNTEAFKLLIVPIILGSTFFSTLDSRLFFYIIGQLCGGLFLTQLFILMHECGHNSFFYNTSLNKYLGHFASFFSFIPYFNWHKIHHLHHQWTGWRDKDPTTEGTFADQLSPAQVKIVNFCWKYYIPIFSMGYRFGIYWKQEKLKKYLSAKDYKFAMTNIYLYLIFYVIFLIFNFSTFLLILPAIYISWMITDIIMLSQHAHIKMQHSNNECVTAFNFKDQPQYTRSIKLHYNVAKYIFFNFNLHEAHHAYPGMPCYLLHRLNVEAKNTYPLMSWLKKVKSMDGVDYIFKSSANREGF